MKDNDGSSDIVIVSGDPSRISHKRAKIYYKAVNELEQKLGRSVEAEDVIAAAKADKGSVFWLDIPKDADKALLQIQLEMARRILKVAKVFYVDYKGRKVTTKARESVTSKKSPTRVFVRHETVRSTKVMLKVHLEYLLRELETWFDRARTYPQLGGKPLEAIEVSIKIMKKNVAAIGKN